MSNPFKSNKPPTPTNNPFKRALLDILDFLKYKVDTNGCTPKEMQAAFRILSEQTITQATTKDIAEFYGQSNSNVRNIISRWGIKGESKRYYNFAELQEYVPKSWRKPQRDEDSPVLTQGYYTPTEYDVAAEPDTPYGTNTNN